MINRVLIAAAAALILAGCQSDNDFYAKRSAAYAKMPICDQIAYALNDPYLTQNTKMVAMEVGRNRGCFGQPQTQRLQIDQTVTIKQQ